MPSITDAIGARVAYRVLQMYGLDGKITMPEAKGYRNISQPVQLADGSTVNLLFYKGEPGITLRIQNANKVSDYLARHGFVTRRTLDDRVMRVTLSGKTKYAVLYSYLDGETIPWEAYTMRHLKQLGKTLSDMHDSLKHFPIDGLPDVVTVYRGHMDRMRAYFEDTSVQRAMREKLFLEPPQLCMRDSLLEICAYLPGTQPLHMDFVRGNILYSGIPETVKISGILDFEKVAVGPPVFDIARTLAFLNVDCKYKTSEKVYKYFLQSGYMKRGAADFNPIKVKVHGSTLNVLPELVNMFLMYDLYKFLRHNPYEDLPANEHFVRTAMLLSRRGATR